MTRFALSSLALAVAAFAAPLTAEAGCGGGGGGYRSSSSYHRPSSYQHKHYHKPVHVHHVQPVVVHKHVVDHCHHPHHCHAFVQPGDSLYTISLREYGNAAFWRKMAEFNGLHPSAPLAIGQPIKLPTIYDSGRMIPSNAPAPPQPLGVAQVAVGPRPGGPAVGGPAPGGLALGGPAPGGPIQASFPGQGMLAPQGPGPQGPAPQGFAPQGLPQQSGAPQGFAPQGQPQQGQPQPGQFQQGPQAIPQQGQPQQGPPQNFAPGQPQQQQSMPQMQAPQQQQPQQPSVPVQLVSNTQTAPEANVRQAPERQAPLFTTGSELVLDGKEFGETSGGVRLMIGPLAVPVAISNWTGSEVTVKLPMLELAGPADAEMIVFNAEGKVVTKTKIRLVASQARLAMDN